MEPRRVVLGEAGLEQVCLEFPREATLLLANGHNEFPECLNSIELDDDVLSGPRFRPAFGKRAFDIALARVTSLPRALFGGNLMHLKSVTALLAAFLLCAATGCQLGGGGCGAGGCGAMPGCDSGGGCFGGGCSSGACGGLAGLLGGGGCGLLGGGGGCQDPSGCVTPETLTMDGYGARGGVNGPLSGLVGHHHRGPQSHMGPPGPADGPAVAQVTYPYYTTRGPRDYFESNPPSIGP